MFHNFLSTSSLFKIFNKPSTAFGLTDTIKQYNSRTARI